jgi:hypothetical protein
MRKTCNGGREKASREALRALCPPSVSLTVSIFIIIKEGSFQQWPGKIQHLLIIYYWAKYSMFQ